MGDERGIGGGVELKWWRWQGLTSRSWAGLSGAMIFKVQGKIHDGLSVLWTSGEINGGDEKDNQPRICVWYDGTRGGRMR